MTIECYDYMTYEYHSKISYGKPDNILFFTQYVLKIAAKTLRSEDEHGLAEENLGKKNLAAAVKSEAP